MGSQRPGRALEKGGVSKNLNPKAGLRLMPHGSVPWKTANSMDNRHSFNIRTAKTIGAKVAMGEEELLRLKAGKGAMFSGSVVRNPLRL